MPDEGVITYQDLIVTPCITDRLLAIAYLKMEAEGTLDAVFYMGRPSMKEFIDGSLEAGKVVLGCFRQKQDDSEPEFCGIGWVVKAERLSGFIKAETGMCFFRQTKNTDNLTFGRLMLGSFFSRHNVDVLFGLTPEPNKLALRYAKRLNFDMIGPVPDLVAWQGKLCPGWISHMSKEQWMERAR